MSDTNGYSVEVLERALDLACRRVADHLCWSNIRECTEFIKYQVLSEASSTISTEHTDGNTTV